jgi:hypothetical protein
MEYVLWELEYQEATLIKLISETLR